MSTRRPSALRPSRQRRPVDRRQVPTHRRVDRHRPGPVGASAPSERSPPKSSRHCPTMHRGPGMVRSPRSAQARQSAHRPRSATSTLVAGRPVAGAAAAEIDAPDNLLSVEVESAPHAAPARTATIKTVTARRTLHWTGPACRFGSSPPSWYGDKPRAGGTGLVSARHRPAATRPIPLAASARAANQRSVRRSKR